MSKNEIVRSTVSYLEQKLMEGGQEGLGLDEVARRIGYSKYYLGRLFREHTGVTIHQYIKERRLTEAARKLVYTDRPIADIADEAGYRSQQSFTSAFSTLYLRAPMDYRTGGSWQPLRTPHATARIVLHGCAGRRAAA